jgi:hypothetical protein
VLDLSREPFGLRGVRVRHHRRSFLLWRRDHVLDFVVGDSDSRNCKLIAVREEEGAGVEGTFRLFLWRGKSEESCRFHLTFGVEFYPLQP